MININDPKIDPQDICEELNRIIPEYTVDLYLNDTAKNIINPNICGNELLLGSNVNTVCFDISSNINPDKKFMCSIFTRGNISITNARTNEEYKQPSEYPNDLWNMIISGDFWLEQNKYVYNETNWYELFINDENDKNLDCIILDTPKTYNKHLRLILENLESKFNVKINWTKFNLIANYSEQNVHKNYAKYIEKWCNEHGYELTKNQINEIYKNPIKFFHKIENNNGFNGECFVSFTEWYNNEYELGQQWY